MTRPIDRANLKRCIACKRYYPMTELVGKAFPAGHNFRFYLCISCWREAKELKCERCEQPLTALNSDLRTTKQGYRVASAVCMPCVYKERQWRGLAAKYPSIVRYRK